MLNFLKNLLDSNERHLAAIRPLIDNINSFESEVSKLTQDEIRAKTQKWKNDLYKLEGDDLRVYLDAILPEAFAVVRESAKRVRNMRHFDVQLMAGIALHQGKIAEQKTGEGKTLTATLALYLNALTGYGASLVTPNDYLSRHGAGWMGPIYDYAGVSVGVIMQEDAYVFDAGYTNAAFKDEYAVRLRPVDKQTAYKSDIVYGTNHAFGFDYLRDNMVYSLNRIVQTNPRGEWGRHYFAVVDEVDSILIDVARTPLIISTSAAQPTSRYHQASSIVSDLIKDQDYEVDEKFRSSTLTDIGIRKVERMLSISNLYEQDFEMVHLIEQALSARALYQKDRDYVVQDGKVLIIDQFTGRILPSNRYSHGLHQAIESKENVAIQEESRTLAEVSYQNYFRMYERLAGMTGTALTEAEEFYKIYKLDVVVIPTHKKNVRIDLNDVVYKTEAAKFSAVADEIAEKHRIGQPVLVGTTSVEKSELLHEFLKRKKIPHEILNAKNHEQEALIIAQAGHKGAVTVSTNMAGRGVDILLGGDPQNADEFAEIKSAGGLHVIGTERHESRRIDNQLRGRAARQGDPGSSRFYVSLQDELMRIFGGEQIENLMSRFGLEENVPLEAGIVSKAIESAQKKVEGLNFDRRKQTVEMDDVINVHRDVVYKLRRRILELGSGKKEHKEWFVSKLDQYAGLDLTIWAQREKDFGEETWLRVASDLSLNVLDFMWMDHLVDMDDLREGIGLRGYAQRDPMVEYKREGHARFEALIEKIYKSISDAIVRLNEAKEPVTAASKATSLEYKHAELETGVSEEMLEMEKAKSGRMAVDPLGRSIKVESIKSGEAKVGRNDPCPCGSGKKYKNCHGK